MMNQPKRVGELRPSQLMFTFGVGALIDLPYLSAVVMGLDDWPLDPSIAPTISEERLLRMVRWQLGEQVARLVAPPAADSSGPLNPFSLAALTGVPVATFPRWLVCPRCELLAPLSTGLFELKHDAYHPERTRYIHTNCNRISTPIATAPNTPRQCRRALSSPVRMVIWMIFRGSALSIVGKRALVRVCA
ncbi:MAG: hypothetical protein R3C14_14605 [Caldilineaceae bacterium]